MAKQLQIKLVRSAIGFEKSQKETVKALGLNKLHKVVLHNDTPQIRGMIFKVQHLLQVEEVES
jgi:large subunit ribosomal protein L30